MNRFIAEKVMGVREFDYCVTEKGNRRYKDYTGPDKAALMDHAVEQEWWADYYRFAVKKWLETWKPDERDHFAAHFVSYLWRNFDSLVAEYHGWKE